MNSLSSLKIKCVFLMVGGGCFIIDLSLYLTLIEVTNLKPFIARIIAFSVALGLTWLGNRKLTFKGRQQLSTAKQFHWVLLVAMVSALTNLGGFQLMRWSLLEQALPVSQHLIPKIITPMQAETVCLATGVLFGLVVNWFGSNYVTFRAQPALQS